MCVCTALDRTSATTVSRVVAALRSAEPHRLRRRARHSCAPVNPAVQIQRYDQCSRCASEGGGGACAASCHTLAPLSAAAPLTRPAALCHPYNLQLMEREKQRHLKGGHWAPPRRRLSPPRQLPALALVTLTPLPRCLPQVRPSRTSRRCRAGASGWPPTRRRWSRPSMR